MIRKPVQQHRFRLRRSSKDGQVAGGAGKRRNETTGCLRLSSQMRLWPSARLAVTCDVPMMPSTVGCRAMALAKSSSTVPASPSLSSSGLRSGELRIAAGSCSSGPTEALRKDHVEHHHARTRGKKLVDQLGEYIAAPRPGAERLHRAFVDVDDANRIACVGRSRQGLLQDVEAQQAQSCHEAGVGLADGYADRNDAEV